MKNKMFLAVGMAAIGVAHQHACAVLALTGPGIADGFGLSTFATGFPNGGNTNTGNIGPLGIAFTNNGGVMVSDFPGNVRIFPTDTDGQSAGSVPAAATYGNAGIWDFAQDGATIYSTNNTTTMFKVNQNGSRGATVTTGLSQPRGLVFDTYNGYLLLATQTTNSIREIDPVTGNTVLTISGVSGPDGITLSADGGTVYAAANSQIVGFNTASGLQVFSAGVASASSNSGTNYLADVDGTAIGTGNLSGYIFGNTNLGYIVQVSLSNGVQTPIASGGSRGDFVTVDPKDGSLLATQTDSIVRLTGNVLIGSHPMISIGTMPPTVDGLQITNGTGPNQGVFSSGTNTLTVSGSHGSYTVSQVTGINNSHGVSSGFVAVTGFNPATDTEIYAMDVLIDGQQATTAQIATLVSDINGAHSYSFNNSGSSVASASDPSNGFLESLAPPTPYNLFLTLNGETSGSEYFGFDLTQDPTFGTSATVVAIAVVPEPATFGLIAVSAVAILTRRKRRDRENSKRDGSDISGAKAFVSVPGA